MKPLSVIGAMRAELEFLINEKEDLRLGGTDVITCGVGKVNAASVMTEICGEEDGEFSVIVVGTAGGIDPKLKIGDIVISDSAQQHDVDASPLGFKRGDIPFESTSTWKANRDLVTAAQKAAKELSLRHTVGRVLSGDRFITDPKEARWLQRNLHGVCVDMETAAIAQVCHRRNIPWVSIRMISDATNKKSPKDFLRTIALASERCGSIVAAL